MYIIRIYACDSKTWQSRIRGNNRVHSVTRKVIKWLSDQIIGSVPKEEGEGTSPEHVSIGAKQKAIGDWTFTSYACGKNCAKKKKHKKRIYFDIRSREKLTRLFRSFESDLWNLWHMFRCLDNFNYRSLPIEILRIHKFQFGGREERRRRKSSYLFSTFPPSTRLRMNINSNFGVIPSCPRDQLLTRWCRANPVHLLRQTVICIF